MKKSLFTQEERQTFYECFDRTKKKEIENLKYYYNGYGICSMERMLPADVPVVVVNATASEAELELLMKMPKYVCLIAVDAALATLLSKGINPHLFVVSENSKVEKYEEYLKDCKIPMVTCMDVDSAIMKQHKGKKFFYWTENLLEKYVWSQAKEALSRLYRYNILVKFGEVNDCCDVAVQIGRYMGASDLVIVGNGLAEQELKEMLQNECDYVTFDLEDIVSKIIPLFDESGKQAFKQCMYSLIEEDRAIREIVTNGIEVYLQLYNIAIKGGDSTQLQSMVELLNQYTAMLETKESIGYVLNILSVMDTLLLIDSTQSIDCSNEVSRVAIEGIATYEKISIICDMIAENISITVDDLESELGLYEMAQVETQRPNILLVCGRSQYNVLPWFVYGLKKGFQQLGYHTYLFDSNKQSIAFASGYNHYQKTIGYDYVFLMNGVFIDMRYHDSIIGQERYLFDNENTKILAMFVDHPKHHLGRLVYTRGFVDVLVPDNNWKVYMSDYMPEIKSTYFLPLGGIEQGERSSFEQKENKIVFFGSYQNLEELKEEINKKRHAELIWNIVDVLLKNPSLTIEQAMRNIALEQGCQYSMENILIHTDVFETVDSYIRHYFRQRVVTEIVEAGVPIDLYGWKDDRFAGYTNVQCKEAVPISEMLEICRNTRFVLNIQPWLKAGTQERVFNTMLGGSISVTDSTAYLEKECVDETHLLLYRLEEVERLPEKLLYYMEHEAEAAQIAQNGYELAKERHTWPKRAEQLVELIDMKKIQG